MQKMIISEDIETIIDDIPDIKRYADKKILITGVNGIIGTYFALVYLVLNEKYDLNISIYALARNRDHTTNRFEGLGYAGGMHVIEGDLASPEKIDFPEQIDVIIHAASQTSPWHFKNDPVGTLSVNSIGTNYLLDYARTANSECFLYLSTREIYGDNYENRKFADENYYGPLDPSQLRSCYPESKKFGEMCCIAYSEQYGINCKIARIAHTYGPSMKLDDGRIIGDFVNHVLANEDIILNTDGSSLIALTYISDVISGLFRLMADRVISLCNIANDEEVFTVKEFARTMASLSQVSQVRHREQNSEVPMYLAKQPALLKSDRIRSAGWSVKKYSLEGLKRTVEYYQNLRK